MYSLINPQLSPQEQHTAPTEDDGPHKKTTAMATCSVCLDDCKTLPLKIGGDPVCLVCIKTGIIPKFHAALKHESQYPPTFGRYRLRPQDFKLWIENFDDFAAQWREREYEYLTPVGIRLYCGKCGHYVCERNTRRVIRLRCSWCSALICAACGLVDKVDTKHQCPKVDANPYESLVRGKDYQRCPKNDCGIVVELKEACNSMRCTSASCMTQFCFICGEVAAHNSDHWTAGSNCPRFNQPGATNAQFDRPPPEAEGPQPPPPPQIPPPPPRVVPTAAAIIQLLNEGIGDRAQRLKLVRLVENLPRLPALPALPIREPNSSDNNDNDGPHHRICRLQAEQTIAPQLLATDFGILMRHQQGQLDAMLQVAQALIHDHEDRRNPDDPLPQSLNTAVDFMLKLRANLDVYAFRTRLVMGWPHYARRHADIRGWRRLSDDVRSDILTWFPALEGNVLAYEAVAPLRGLWDLGDVFRRGDVEEIAARWRL